MKSYLRIIITGMVALCVTIPSFAGLKKCYKKPAIFRYHLSILQKSASHEKNESNSSLKEYCVSSYSIIDHWKEEECKSWHPDTNYIATDFPFRKQDYTNHPFAPPRFV
jgi:hypothetical protein